jgi:hypothetical protein
MPRPAKVKAKSLFKEIASELALSDKRYFEKISKRNKNTESDKTATHENYVI